MQKTTAENSHTTEKAAAISPIKSMTMQKRIGSITYEVEVYFNPEARETMEQKILRLIKSEMGAAV